MFHDHFEKLPNIGARAPGRIRLTGDYEYGGKKLWKFDDAAQQDLIEGFIRLMNTSDDVTGPINLGNPGEFTILQLAELVVKMTKSKSRAYHRENVFSA